MPRKRLRFWLLLPACLLTAISAQAGGFSLYEQGARATALGGAFTATADDATAVFYNAAGLGYLSGANLSVNGTFLFPSNKFAGAQPPTPGATGETTSDVFFIPGMYFSYTLPSGWGFGVGLYAPFGLGVQWQDPTNWVGRTTSYDVFLGTIYVTPAAAYKLNEQWSVALGADIAWQWIELNRFNAFPFGGSSTLLNSVDVNLEGTSDINITPTAGLLFRPTEKWSFGIMYHHKKTFKYSDGDGRLTNVVPADDPGLAAVRASVDAQITSLGGPEHTIATEINIPYILSFGARYRINERATLEFNAVHWSWSDFDQIDLVFDGNPDSDLNETIRESYADRWQIRLGLEADLGKQWRGLLGFIHDKTPQPVESMGPLLPDATRNDFSLGVQYDHERWSFIGTYMLVLNNERSTVQGGQVTYFPGSTDEEIAARRLEAGSYKSMAHIFGVGVNYNF